MSASGADLAGGRLFSFAQFEFPWPLGPADGRYLLRPGRVTGDGGTREGGTRKGGTRDGGTRDGGTRDGGTGDGGTRDGGTRDGGTGEAPTHVIVVATLGAPERRRLATPRRRARLAQPEPSPTAVATGRATVIDVARPLPGPVEADAWLRAAGEPAVEDALATLNRALHAFRLVTADPYLQPVARHQAIVARIGYGAGEQVADGLWTDAREPVAPRPRRGRSRVLQPQARLAAVLGAREPVLVCEELLLRARLDLDHDRPREAALQVLVALDAAVAELSSSPRAGTLADRLSELRGQRDPVAGAAQSALTGPLTSAEYQTVQFTVGRIEASLRAWIVTSA